MSGILHILIGTFGIAFSLLILRADPRRWDNRSFATLGMLDASMALFRGITAASGAELTDRAVMLPCAGLSPLLAWWSIEFAYTFPFNRRMPWRWRLPLVAATIATSLTLVLGGGNRAITSIANAAFFIPAMLVMVTLAVTNLRRVAGDRFGVRLLIAALLVRWISANIVYSLIDDVAPDAWATMLWIESTIVALIALVMIAFAIIRSNLFTIRSAMGELALESAFLLAGLLLTAAAIDGALRIGAEYPFAQRAALLIAALTPLLVFVGAERVRPRLEASVDPRRALRREVLERALPSDDEADPAALAAAAVTALREISGSSDVKVLRELPSDAADALVAPIRRGAHAYGALVVEGGTRDRETMQAAAQLADRLALAHEHSRLVGELDESRRLAALGSFAAAIAHDIRTPLTSVQMNVQILRGKANLPPDDMEYFDIALDELRRLEGHVKELLDYAKPLQLHRETVAVKDLTEDAARTAAPILAERRVRLACDHAPGVPAVSVDPHRMKQVLWNLLENAANASPEGATIALHTRRDGGRVAIDVVDHGAGIAATDLPRIFEPFFTTRPDGTGLGLAICQKVVKAHAGEILVQSEPAQGSTFTVLLPA